MSSEHCKHLAQTQNICIVLNAVISKFIPKNLQPSILFSSLWQPKAAGLLQH